MSLRANWIGRRKSGRELLHVLGKPVPAAVNAGVPQLERNHLDRAWHPAVVRHGRAVVKGVRLDPDLPAVTAPQQHSDDNRCDAHSQAADRQPRASQSVEDATAKASSGMPEVYGLGADHQINSGSVSFLTSPRSFCQLPPR